MNFAESIDYVYHAKQAGAVKNGLVNITELLKRLGNPEARFTSIHVAGTNGKGSVCAFLESILRAAGYRTGMFTSPYLERFTERIRICGDEIDEEEFALLATRVREAACGMISAGFTHPTFFELVTACGFLHFANKQVDVAIVEAGLGGRTDATNVLSPVLSVITSIGVDHAAVLGGTIGQIAQEKAGIVKPGTPCVVSGANGGEALEIIRREAEGKVSRLVFGGDCTLKQAGDSLNGQAFDLSVNGCQWRGLRITLLGGHQLSNASTALLAALELKKLGYELSETIIREGLSMARWPGRMELLRREPPFLIDGAHNPQGAEALASAVLRYFGGRHVCLVMGAMEDKDAGLMVRHLSTCSARAITTLPPSHGRQQRSAGELARLFEDAGVHAETCADWRQALRLALESGMPVVVAGSLYLVGAVRTWWRSVAGADFIG